MIYGYKYNTGYINLKRVLSENDIMQCFIADYLGITVQTFSRKINRNNAYFTDDERATLRRVLNNLDEDLFAYVGPNGKLVCQQEYLEEV